MSDVPEATRKSTGRPVICPSRKTSVLLTDAAHVTALIYAPALDHLVGTPEIMIAQLGHLLALSQRHNVVIQVVPDAGYFAGDEGPFEIASGPGISDTGRFQSAIATRAASSISL